MRIEMTNTSDEERAAHMRVVSKMDGAIILHDGLTKAISGIKHCIAWSESSREPVGIIVSGDAGVGKSTLSGVVLDLFKAGEAVRGDCKVQIVPAYYAAIPEAGTPKSTASSMLKAHGDPKPYSGQLSAMTTRLTTLLDACETRFVILDEFHHLLGKGVKTGERVCNWIKTLVNDTRVLFCLVGNPACEDLLKSNGQLARRFAYRFRLTALGCGNEEKGGQLDYRDYTEVWRIGLATRGVPAYIKLIVREAALRAMASGRQVITMADFAHAYEMGITSAVSLAPEGINPFALDIRGIKSIYYKNGGRIR
jgi:type II secretory pathway predicted ATPase ExeA